MKNRYVSFTSTSNFSNIEAKFVYRFSRSTLGFIANLHTAFQYELQKFKFRKFKI